MALLKAFVCQIILLGLYKLFLEQVVEEHLVPDEVTRNCLVGFVCLLCFGIQLYTEKDEDRDEADEDSKSKSCGKTNAKNSEPAEIPVAFKTAESNLSSRVAIAKPPTASPEIAREMKMSPNDQQAVDLRERDNVVLSPEVEKVIDVTNCGLFYQFSTNISNTIPNGIKEDEMKEEEEAVLVSQFSNEQTNKTTNPVFNGISETIVCEESEENGIEIDQFVSKEAEKVEQSITIEADEVEMIKPGDEAEKARLLRTSEYDVVKYEDETEKDQELRAVEVETIKLEDVEETIVKSKCLVVDGENIASTKDLDETTVPTIDEPGKAQIFRTSEVEMVEPEDETEEDPKLRTVEGEMIKHEYVSEAAVESKCLVSGENTSSMKDSDETSIPKIGELETYMTSCLYNELSKDTDNVSSRICKDIESKQSVKDEAESKIIFCPPPESDELLNSTESSPSAQKMKNSSSSEKTVNNVTTTNTDNVKSSTLAQSELSSSSEKPTLSSTQKIATAGDVCLPIIAIDISFIYACH